MLNKYDIMLIVAVILGAGVMAFVLGKNLGNSSNQLSISIDKKQLGTYNSEENQEIVIKEGPAYNIVEIKDKKVKMISANCPDGYCLKQGPISQGSGTIVCLPNKIILEFRESNSYIDTVVG